MSETLFKRVDTGVEYLVSAVDNGALGLPDIQRPFVWSTAKVRDLFDSMFKGYPVGYLLLWENPSVTTGRAIGLSNTGFQEPNTLIIDGQQRLTSLYAVMKGRPILDKNFRERQLVIAFNPLEAKFEVASAAHRRSIEWISDISEVYLQGGHAFRIINEYIEELETSRGEPLEQGESDRVAGNIERLLKLRDYPFSALQINGDADEEEVADIFVRVNSQGQNLKQSDFILTLLSVFWEDGRLALEKFCKNAHIPPKPGSGPSPFNHHIDPEPDQLLRVGIAVGLRRARLKYAYQFLRGKDVESGTFKPEVREENLGRLRSAQDKVLDLANWHQFMKALVTAGFRSRSQISSKNALLYCYTFFLIGKHDHGLDAATLKGLVARLFMMVTLTGRYSSSPESTMDEDLARLRAVHDAGDFVRLLSRLLDEALTRDYWEITLPSDLETSSANAAVLNAYHAAQNLLGARVLFSDVKVSDLMDPNISPPRSQLERHHLFPRGFLRSVDITEIREVNQIANFALVEWEDNADISDRDPAEYVPRYEKRYARHLSQMYQDHALPPRWYEMDYTEFLVERRALMAGIIRRAYDQCMGPSLPGW